jgi:hypothetical protein
MYPQQHYDMCQEKAWMEQSLWSYYIEYVLAPAIKNPSVLVVGNLDCYVSDESVNLVVERLEAKYFPCWQTQHHYASH